MHQHRVAGVVHDGGVGCDRADEFGAFAFKARLFQQFTHTGLKRRGIFVVDDAAGDLQFDGIRTMTVLLHHHQFVIRGEGDDIYPVVGFDDVELVLLIGAGRALAITAGGEHAVIVQRLGFYQWPRSDLVIHVSPSSGSQSPIFGGPALTHQRQ